MSKSSGGTRSIAPSGASSRRQNKDSQYYYERAKEEKQKALDGIKGIQSVSFSNGISGTLQISKSDIRTITGKNIGDNKFNAIKNKFAQDIPGFIRKATYEGWRDTIAGKHVESSYFAYYSRELGYKFYLCLRKMKDSTHYKPYAIISERQFNEEIGKLKKTAPPQ